MSIKEFFKPTVLKVLMSIFLFIFIFSLISLNFIQIFWSLQNIPALLFLINVIISAVLGYLIGSCIDYFVKNNTIKIIIAVILAIFAIIAGWTALTSRVMVCDPVHEPGPVVCDPVHQP